MDNSPEFIFKDYIPIILRLENEDVSRTNYSFVSVKSIYEKSVLNSNGVWEYNLYDLNLTTCNFSKFPEKYQDHLNSFSLQNGMCVEFDNNPQLNSSLSIYGSWTKLKANRLEFYAIINDSLRFDSELFNESLYLSIYSLDEMYDPLNYSFPAILTSIFNTFR